MMTTYKISAIVAAEDVVKLVQSSAIPRDSLIIQEWEAEPEYETGPAAPPPPRKSRKPRGSKVEATILGVLSGGQKTSKELKAALENAGLRGGSMGVGIANLQKRGEVKRADDGSYYIFAKAAE
jgi:hypothetical protein